METGRPRPENEIIIARSGPGARRLHMIFGRALATISST
jgi:hypothetical protein